MLRARRVRTLSLVFIGATALFILGWGAVIFATIWLRGRCAREFAGVAQQLELVHIIDQSTESASPATPEINFGPLDVFVTGPDSRAQFTASGGRGYFSIGKNKPNFVATLNRLEMLQIYSPRVVWGELLGSNKSDVNAAPVDVPFSSYVYNPIGELQLSGAGETHRLSEFSPPPSCYEVNDTAGNRLWMIVRPVIERGGDSHVDPSWSESKQEFLIIDSSGRLESPIASPGGILLGKLPAPLAKADQLVFGKAMRLAIPRSRQGESQLIQVCVVENGRIKVVREIAVCDRGQRSSSEIDPIVN